MNTVKIIKNIPSTIGIYIFLKKNTPIYIGKSINLKARIKSHYQNAKLIRKEKLIIDQLTKIKWIVTFSEFEALLLEAKLIKKYQPKYNSILKDDKSNIYIKVTVKDKYPKVLLVRKENDKKSLYFGPFSSTQQTEKILKYLRKITQFCTCKKITTKPCFYSHIGLCDPCPNKIETILFPKQKLLLKKQYLSNIKSLKLLLNGKLDKIFKKINSQLKKATNIKDYETAIMLRNRLLLLNQLITNKLINSETEVYYNNKKQFKTRIQKFFIKQLNYHLKNNYRIECFDVSNFNNTNVTASMVVFDNGFFDKSQYRRYKLSHHRSDITRLKEVISRRIVNKTVKKADLIIIDGGKQQLSAIYKLLASKGVKILLLAITKNPNRIYSLYPKYHRVDFKFYPQVEKIIINLRDESHRFAKKYHLLLRNKNLLI